MRVSEKWDDFRALLDKALPKYKELPLLDWAERQKIRRIKLTDLEWCNNVVFDNCFALSHTLPQYNTARIFFAVNDDQQIPLDVRRQLTQFSQDKSAAIRLRKANSIAICDEEAFNVGGVSVFVVNSMITGKVPIESVRQYLSLIGPGVKLKEYLGDGTDGPSGQRVRHRHKDLRRENAYFNERDSYRRLAEYGVTERIDGFWIPKMIRCVDELWAVEMDFDAASALHHRFCESND